MHLLGHLHFPWDYDLGNDGELLRDRRAGMEWPFEYAPGFWHRMRTRDRQLALEEVDR